MAKPTIIQNSYFTATEETLNLPIETLNLAKGLMQKIKDLDIKTIGELANFNKSALYKTNINQVQIRKIEIEQSIDEISMQR